MRWPVNYTKSKLLNQPEMIGQWALKHKYRLQNSTVYKAYIQRKNAQILTENLTLDRANIMFL